MSSELKTKRATVYFDPEIHRALRLKAAEMDETISDLVNDAVRTSLAEDAEDLEVMAVREPEPDMPFEEFARDLNVAVNYRIFVKRSAQKEIRDLPTRKTRRAVVAKLQSLAEDPKPVGCVKLTGADTYRIRLGVSVVPVAHRSVAHR